MTTAPIRYLSSAEVSRALAECDPVAVARSAMEQHARGESMLPAEAALRWRTPDDKKARSLVLPGGARGRDGTMSYGAKVINASLANAAAGMPRASGVTLLYDEHTARVRCIMAAAELSALRTAAVSMVAAEALAVAPRRAAVIGAGALADAHVGLLLGHPRLRAIDVFDLRPGRAQNLVERYRRDAERLGVVLTTTPSARAAIEGAELIVTVTTAEEGYIPLEWLEPGSVVVLVSLDDLTEEAAIGCDRLIVDSWALVSGDELRLLGRLHAAGRLDGPGDEPRPGVKRVDAELGDVLIGQARGRTDDRERVLVNPFGMSLTDVLLAAEVAVAAERLDLGVLLER